MAHADFSKIQAGLIPIGTELPGFGTIVFVSDTAYQVGWDIDPFSGIYRNTAWLAFQKVHGKPEPVEPLVVFS